MKIKKGKITHYKRSQYIYGLYALLIALDYYESIENYNDCYCILQAIKENEKLLNTTFAKNLKESDFRTLDKKMKETQRFNATRIIEYQEKFITDEIRSWM